MGERDCHNPWRSLVQNGQYLDSGVACYCFWFTRGFVCPPDLTRRLGSGFTGIC